MAEAQALMERLESAVVKLELLLSDAHKVAECGTVNGVDGGMIQPSFSGKLRTLNAMWWLSFSTSSESE